MKLHEWYAHEREKYKLNLAGIEKGLCLPTNSLHDFVKNGYISKAVYPVALKYALEHGFKYQPNQCGFRIDETICEIAVLEIVGSEYIETSNIFLIHDEWKEYNQSRQETPTLPKPKKKVVKKKV